MTNKHVLVIEDEAIIILDWQNSLKRLPIQLTPAVSLEEAERLFPIKENWDAIVVDGCLGGDNFNTEALVRAIRERGYTGPMIAASKSPDIRKLLISAGCDEESPKEFVPAHIVKVLNYKKEFSTQITAR